jgi:NAD-dependent dihydropyrimidine dehydrogenase PreA subunit
MKLKYILLVVTLITLLMVVACKKATFAEYNIDRSSCNGCGECIRVCPNDAIYFDTQGKAVIDQSKCTKCAKCVVVCPNNAIY